MRSKIGSILVSIVIAVGLWLYVITAVSPGSTDTYYNIPVVMEGETVLNERGLMITGVSSNTVSVRLSGNRTDLSRVNSGNITVKLDLSKIYEPGSQIPMAYTPTFPGDVPSNAFVIESKYPGNIQVSVARRVTKEDVPVQVKWIGSAPEGFMSDRENRVLDFPNITVSGPDYVVNEIAMAVIEVDLSEQRESISQSYHYTLCDAEGNPVDAELVTTNVEEVRLDVKIQRVKDVKLVYTLVEGAGATAKNARINMSADTIRVSGSEAALDNLGDSITVGTVNLAEINKSSSLTYEVVLPEGVTNLSGVTEVTVDIQLIGLATKEFTIEKVKSINVPEGMEAELFTEKMTVVVRGPSALIQKLTEKDITVSVDFTDAEAGASTFKATVTFAEGFEGLGVFKADPISASIQQKD